MKLINSSFEILDQTLDINGIYKQIELAGRTCYKSEAYITDTSAKEFVERMMKLGHGAILEHGTVYLQFNNTMGKYFSHVQKYVNNQYSAMVEHMDENDLNNLGIYFATYNVTTNLRVLFENEWLDDLQYLCKPTEYHEKRVSVKFICDRGVSHKQFVA